MDQSVHTNLNNAEELTMTLRLTGFLNASHYAVFNGKRGQTHSHSWQLQFEVEIPVNGKELVRFEDLEKILTQALKPYQRTVLNELYPFDKYQPFTENIAAHFFNHLSDLFAEKDSRLTKLVAWENPTKGVEIKQRLPYHLLSGQVSEVPETPSSAPMPIMAANDEVLPIFGVSNEAVNQIAAANDQAENDTVGGSDESENTKNEKDDSGANSGDVPPNGVPLEGESETAAIVEPSGDDKKPMPQISWWKWVIIISIIAGVAVAAYYPVLTAVKPVAYPWGSDSWGHLYKAQFLTEQIKQGNYFPQFWADWYNGCPPFRYWAPLPYYALTGLNFLTSDIFIASYYYIFFCALIGALGWLSWRKRLSPGIILIVAIIFLIWPDNVRVAFSEGNFPRILSTALLPILVVCYLNVLEKKQAWGYFIATVILIQVTILCHAMMGAVDCVALFLATIFHWLYGGSSLKDAGRGVAALILGVLTSAWWLLPALSGGLVGMGSGAAGGVFYLPFVDAFNPLNFKNDIEFQYLGISLIPLMILTIITWKKRPVWSKSLFTVGMLLIIISFPSFSWLHRLMPLSDMLWPFRFRSIASLMLLASMAVSYPYIKNVGKKPIIPIITVILLFLVIVDCGYAASKLIYPGEMPQQVLNVSKQMEAKPGWRVATLDISTLGSPPSYLFSVEGGREQVFGWAWQGATTATNIMLLNTAMENKLYPFVIKQLFYLGATDVVTNPYAVKEPQKLNNIMPQYGYQKMEIEGAQLSYWHGLDNPFFLIAKPKGLAIGEFASMYAMQFPSLQIGNSNKIDDYSLEELTRYPLLVLSGADWSSRSTAEELVIAYAQQGGRVVVDLNGFPEDTFSKQPKFLNVYGQAVSLRGALNVTSMTGEEKTWQPFDSNNLPWTSIVPMPLDSVEWSFNYMNSPAAVFGYTQIAGGKIGFLGANPVYHSFLTGDPIARKMLGRCLGLSEDFDPPVIIPVQSYQVDSKGYTFTYTLNHKEKVILPVARFDGLDAYVNNKKVVTESYENLVSIELPAGQNTIRISLASTPIYKLGWMVTTIACIAILLMVVTGAYQRRKSTMKI